MTSLEKNATRYSVLSPDKIISVSISGIPVYLLVTNPQESLAKLIKPQETFSNHSQSAITAVETDSIPMLQEKLAENLRRFSC